MLQETQRDFYRENGYLIVRGLVSNELVADVRTTVLELFRRFEPESFASFAALDLLENSNFHERALAFRQRRPKEFGAIYDTLQVSVSMQRLATNTVLLDAVSFLLNEPTQNLMSFNYLCRMDAPFDTRNRLGWHQDFLVYDQVDMSDGLTATMPLMKVTKATGGARIKAGSQVEGRIGDYQPKVSGEANVSDIHAIPSHIIDRYDTIDAEGNAGDVIFICMNTVHSSGENSSDTIRFTGQGRFYKLNSPSFVPGRVQYQASDL